MLGDAPAGTDPVLIDFDIDDDECRARRSLQDGHSHRERVQ
jgi:hypothetical protein